MNQAYDFDDIDDYLHGRMSAQDRLVFERAMEADPDLVRRVDALRAEANVLQRLREEALLGQFGAWEAELERDNRAVPLTVPDGGGIRYRRWLIPAAAAAVAGFLAVGIAFGWFKRSVPDPGIADKPQPNRSDTAKTVTPLPEKDEPYVEQTPKKDRENPSRHTAPDYIAMGDRFASGSGDFDQLRGRDEPAEDDSSRIAQAVKLYNAKRFKDALVLLQRPDSAQLQQFLYLRGLSYYHLGLYDSAGKDFREFRHFELAEKKYDAQWWEALCLLKQMPRSRAKLVAVLQEMIDTPDHPKGGDAAKLLQELR